MQVLTLSNASAGFVLRGVAIGERFPSRFQKLIPYISLRQGRQSDALNKCSAPNAYHLVKNKLNFIHFGQLFQTGG